ncbi:coiled-coil domain-containing protein 39-like [Copidosoma floridanum]|uniref:coiled-coil domain-containing protein 39-like n=1 Tax=Copidosoma floridanum TaxID=29053 RepID=UPI0006C9BF6D|nr:coiled-coil domain-containing protein 39-like [Copidosoma floridanum]
MTSAVQAVLSELGWGDGFRIPIANAANKRLEEEIERKTRERAALRTRLANLEELTSEIQKHGTDVRQEQSQNQRLLAAHAAQLEAEKHLYGLSRMEEGRLRRESKLAARETSETEERTAVLKQRLAKSSRKLEDTKRGIALDKESLADWEEKLNRAEEKNLVIEHFVRTDDKSFKKIELERRSLSDKADTYRRTILKADSDVRELELVLSETARYYSQAVKDRRHLMDQWSQSVRALKQRGKAISDARQEMNSLRERAKARMDAYEEAERFLEIQVSENRELEYGIRGAERELVKQRDERHRATEAMDALAVELVAKRKELQEVTRRTVDTRANGKRKRAEVEESRVKLDECKRRVRDLKETLKNIDWQTMNVEERTRQLQDMLEREEKRKATINREIKRQQDLITRAEARLAELDNERKMVAMQQQAESKRWERLVAELSRQKKLLKEKKECAYRADVELQRHELRLQVMLGQENDKDKLEAKQERIKQLSRVLKDKSEMLKALQAQMAQVENDVRKLTSEMVSKNEELQQLRDKKQELCLLLDGGEKQLKAAQSSHEGRQVDENMLKLKVREAERIASKVGGKLYTLEKLALEMEAAMQERMSEIKAQKEGLVLRRRLAQADCAELRGQVVERKARVQQLQARYGIIVACLGTNPEDGTPLDTTYLKIQSAQERYVLQEHGDQLDRAIRKAEHEIRSMENTLKLVNACNAKYKDNLSLVEDGAPEVAEQARLDEETTRVLETMGQKRRALDRALEDCKRMEENCAQLDEDVKRIKEEKEDKRQTVADLEQQITEQGEKISRADKNLRRILKDIRDKCVCTSNESMLLQERDIELRELQELNQLALQRIAEFTIRHVEAEAYVKKLLDERGIALPSAYYLRLQQQYSSRCESTASSYGASSSRVQNNSGRDMVVGSIVQLEPQFEAMGSAKSLKVSSSRSQRQTPKKKK